MTVADQLADIVRRLDEIESLALIRNALDDRQRARIAAARQTATAALAAERERTERAELLADARRDPVCRLRATGGAVVETRPGRHKPGVSLHARHGTTMMLRRSELDARLGYDRDLRELVASGRVVVEDLDDDTAIRHIVRVRQSL